jgi:enamine deaminase RidA (YjgF/YER057c/UK114 family)
MSHLRHIAQPDGVAPAFARGYSHVVTASGQLVVVSGQISFDESGAVVGPGDPALQAEQAFENVRRCLAAAGATFDDVVKLTYYVTDIRYLAEVRVVRDRLFPREEKPASTAVQVVALALPELLVEIDALAVVAG